MFPSFTLRTIILFCCLLCLQGPAFAKFPPLDPALKPFYHGIASGDPLSNQVIIWTRVTPEKDGPIQVKWKVSKNQSMTDVVASGDTLTNLYNDYTLKIDVPNLQPGTTYYYQFDALQMKSPVGKTKTTPLMAPENLRFAVVSCNNFEEGYFAALGKVAVRNNIDAVIHLGDYIYENVKRGFDKQHNYDDTDPLIPVAGKNKEWWLKYYRKRYAVNHTDVDLQQAHMNHPFMLIWDDHEFADNAYKDGAGGHNLTTDGPWEDRKAAAKQAYAEWAPIRGNASKIYRTFRYGNLVDLFMLDTRVEGRDKQILNINDKDLYAPDRTLLGATQKQWLLTSLKESKAQWKVMANQVIFSEFNVKWAADLGPIAGQFKDIQGNLLDYWEGYPAEREEIIKTITANKINNVVILSGSMHCSIAMDVALRPSKFSKKNMAPTYDPKTGAGSVAVEFATPSISSNNVDERIGSNYASMVQNYINKKIPFPVNANPNPQMKFVDLVNHGYYILSLSKTKVQANYYFIENRQEKNSKERFVEGWYSLSGQNRLQQAKAE